MRAAFDWQASSTCEAGRYLPICLVWFPKMGPELLVAVSTHTNGFGQNLFDNSQFARRHTPKFPTALSRLPAPVDFKLHHYLFPQTKQPRSAAYPGRLSLRADVPHCSSVLGRRE
jgi:hypothetical protein